MTANATKRKVFRATVSCSIARELSDAISRISVIDIRQFYILIPIEKIVPNNDILSRVNSYRYYELRINCSDNLTFYMLQLLVLDTCYMCNTMSNLSRIIIFILSAFIYRTYSSHFFTSIFISQH